MRIPVATIFVLAVLSNQAQATSPLGVLDNLADQATTAYMVCSLKAASAHRQLQFNGSQEGLEAVARCVADQNTQVASSVAKLEPLVATNPKAESALQEFYGLWQIGMADITKGMNRNIILAMRQKIQIVRMEQAW